MSKDEMIAYCGIDCTKCRIYKATQVNDETVRVKTAEQLNKDYGSSLKPEDINCDGCLIEDRRLTPYCAMCAIRKCARERKKANCAYCEGYACEKLIGKLDWPGTKAEATLNKIRKENKF